MKKLISIVLGLTFVLGLAGCTNNQDEIKTFSFRGEHEYFSISNGSIVLNDAEEVFYGGELEITDSEAFTDMSSFTVTFYTLINGEKDIIMSNSVIDETGGSVNISGDLGRMSGEGLLTGSKIDNVSDLKNNLYFELSFVNLDGVESTYQIQLTVTDKE